MENPTHDLQYGFTKNRGPDMASLCLSEALNEASDLKINLVIVSLDTMKAFDVVPHDFLLYRLYHRNPHPSIWKIMDSLLSGQTEKALWGASESEHYIIKQGSGQGKVMGAPLFKVHIHALLEQLTSLDVGFRIGNIAIGHQPAQMICFLSQPRFQKLKLCVMLYITCLDKTAQHNNLQSLEFCAPAQLIT